MSGKIILFKKIDSQNFDYLYEEFSKTKIIHISDINIKPFISNNKCKFYTEDEIFIEFLKERNFNFKVRKIK